MPIATPPPASRLPSPIAPASTIPGVEAGAAAVGAVLEGFHGERVVAPAGIPEQEVRVVASREAFSPGGEEVMSGRADSVLRHDVGVEVGVEAGVGVTGAEPGPESAAGVAPSSEAFAVAGGGPGAVGEGEAVSPTPPVLPPLDASARGGMEGPSEVVAVARGKEIVI